MERLPGFRDFFPPPLPRSDQWDLDARTHLFASWRKVLRNYGFREYDGPPLEPLDLYRKKSGEEILGQLYRFEDRGGRSVALRPEMTPTLVRMLCACQRHYSKPIKWFSIPQLFRYERKQKGRLREHFQLNADIVGEEGAAADAEMVALLIDVLRALGLGREDFHVRLSSRQAWQSFHRGRGGRPEAEYDFYQAVDKLGRMPEEESARRLEETGASLEAVRDFIGAGEPDERLDQVVTDLRARGLGDWVRIDYGIVRGLAYYTGVVFEAFDRKGEFRAIAGGGRYDTLFGLLSDGKIELPALGFGMGDVVLLELLRSRKLLPGAGPSIDVYFLVTDQEERPASLALVQELRDAGVRTDYGLAPRRRDRQIRAALDAGAALAAQARPDGKVALRDLRQRREETLDASALVAGVVERLGRREG